MTNTVARIVPNEIKVSHDIRPDVNREFLTIDVPNGWDDVEKIKGKVLEFDGRKFVFCGWNSDRNECFFFRVLKGALNNTARIVRK